MWPGTGVHPNCDPVTGNCNECGARREEMVDGLAPTCKKIAGPNRVAYRAGQRELYRLDGMISHKQHSMRQAEDACARLSREIRDAETERAELVKTLKFLEQGD